MSQSYRDLIAWQKAMAFVTEAYAATDTFPATERFGLTNQIRRAAVSVASNIAEGKGRLSRREYAQFLARARGSLLEVQTQLEIACNLGYLPRPAFETLAAHGAEVGRLISGLIKSVRPPISNPLTPKT